jgi:dTDP-4-amino-4,6-dideoxygalactose transaminase
VSRPITIPLFKVFMPSTVMDALRETLFSGYIAEGEKTARFTRLVADFVGNPHTVLVSSCTMALSVAYRLSGVGPGTEVITTPLTSVATNVPILALGAKPVWADCDPATGLSDPASIEALISERTRAIVVLHKEGDPAPLREILEIAARHRVRVVEDAAHAFGACYEGVRIGNHGDFTCFSFQAIKHITTADGGALVCKDGGDFARAKRLKWFGVDKTLKRVGTPWQEDIAEWGWKGDLNDVLATIGIEQMKHVSEIVRQHNANGLLYDERLRGVPGVTVLRRRKRDFSSFWAYTMLVERRAELVAKLEGAGVGSGHIHPRNDRWSMFADSARELPGVDYFDPRELSIPCGWWVSTEDVERIASIIAEGW